ncbi:hemolysin XhlA family protein [Clostridium perfringens]|nr:hemolysin XhlA family protein [Clostridium perfringens]
MADQEAIQDIRENIIELKLSIENFIDTNDLKMQILEEKIKVANNRIADLEEGNKWLWRAIVGAVISAVIAIFIKI